MTELAPGILRAAAILIVVAGCGGEPTAVAETAPANAHEALPNVLLIVADDLGYNDISLNGNPLVSTPNIDALAAEGARFLTGYASHSTCSPSRAALMTGRFPQRFGYEYIRTPDAFLAAFDGTYPTEDIAEFREVDRPSEEVAGLPLDEVTIAELLERRGYRTAMIGKWHLGSGRARWPGKQGFDEFFGVPGGAAMYSPADDERSIEARLPWSGIDSFLWDRLRFTIIENGERRTPDGYLTEVFADRAIQAIRRANASPFFVYLAFTAPHTPLDAPRSVYESLTHIEDHKTRVYYAMVEAMDRAIGRVLAALEETGEADNTLVIFTSDNGGAWYTHIPIHNLPYRGWKGTFFEGGINVPFLVRWPTRIPAGRVVEGPASGVDVLPTIAAAAGVALPTNRPIDGVDLLPVITGDATVAQRTLYWAAGDYRVVRKGPWKLQVQSKPDEVWLFNLASDPTEQVNLAPFRTDKVKTLRAELEALDAEMAEPRWPLPYRIKMRVGPYVGEPKAQEVWVWFG